MNDIKTKGGTTGWLDGNLSEDQMFLQWDSSNLKEADPPVTLLTP